MFTPNEFVPFSYKDWNISDALYHLGQFIDQSTDENNIEALYHARNLGNELEKRISISIESSFILFPSKLCKWYS